MGNKTSKQLCLGFLKNYKVLMYNNLFQILKNLDASNHTNIFLVKNKESGKNERLKIVICENFPDLNVGEYYNRLNIIQSFCSYHITPYIMIRRTPEYIVFSVPEFETSLSKLNIQEYFKELDRYTLILEICYATKLLHHYHGLVNGNLKPSNILISKDGHYYVSDLSSYILHSDTSSGYPININSIDYMSPEMLYNKEITTKSDMWSIGVIMYYIFFWNNSIPWQKYNRYYIKYKIMFLYNETCYINSR